MQFRSASTDRNGLRRSEQCTCSTPPLALPPACLRSASNSVRQPDASHSRQSTPEAACFSQRQHHKRRDTEHNQPCAQTICAGHGEPKARPKCDIRGQARGTLGHQREDGARDKPPRHRDTVPDHPASGRDPADSRPRRMGRRLGSVVLLRVTAARAAHGRHSLFPQHDVALGNAAFVADRAALCSYLS